MDIQVEEKQEQKPKPGKCVAIGLIGQALAVFEVWVECAQARYYIDDTEVTREVYLDAMKTADLDRWCDGCMGEDSDEHSHQDASS